MVGGGWSEVGSGWSEVGSGWSEVGSGWVVRGSVPCGGARLHQRDDEEGVVERVTVV